MIRPLTFGLVLTLVATAAWGQTIPADGETSFAVSLDRAPQAP